MISHECSNKKNGSSQINKDNKYSLQDPKI